MLRTGRRSHRGRRLGLGPSALAGAGPGDLLGAMAQSGDAPKIIFSMLGVSKKIERKEILRDPKHWDDQDDLFDRSHRRWR